DRGEQPGLAQPPWKGRARVLDVIGHELVDAARVVVIKKVQFAVVVLTKGDDALAAPGQLLVPGNAILFFEARGPELARDPVAADVGADQVLVTLAAVDIAARDRRPFGVRESEGRRQNGCRAAPAIGPNQLWALGDRPAVVAATLNVIDRLPHLQTPDADPDIAGAAVDAHARWVAEEVGARFRARAVFVRD